jgi:hypothetical protein
MTDAPYSIKQQQATFTECYNQVARLLTQNESGGPSRTDDLFTQVCDHIIGYALNHPHHHPEALRTQVREGCKTFYEQHLCNHIRTNGTIIKPGSVRNKFVVFMKKWMCDSDRCPANKDNVRFSDLLKSYKTGRLPKVVRFTTFYLVYKDVLPKLFIPNKDIAVQNTCEYIAENANLDTNLVTRIKTFSNEYFKNEPEPARNLKVQLYHYVNKLSKHLTDNPSSSNSIPLTVERLLTMFKEHAVNIYPRLILPAPDGWHQGQMKPSSSSAPSASGSSPKDTEISSLRIQLKRKTRECEELQEENHRLKYQKTELQNRTKILMTFCEKHQKLGEGYQQQREQWERMDRHV